MRIVLHGAATWLFRIVVANIGNFFLQLPLETNHRHQTENEMKVSIRA